MKEIIIDIGSGNIKAYLVNARKEIKNRNIGIPIHAYATSVFRMLNKEKLEELQTEIIQATEIKINVLSQQEEEKSKSFKRKISRKS